MFKKWFKIVLKCRNCGILPAVWMLCRIAKTIIIMVHFGIFWKHILCWEITQHDHQDAAWTKTRRVGKKQVWCLKGCAILNTIFALNKKLLREEEKEQIEEEEMQSYHRIFTEDKMITNKDGGNDSMILCENKIPNDFKLNIFIDDHN